MPVDFALIGHQESWRAAADVLAILRGPTYPPIPDDEVEDIFPWIPPRVACHVDVRSVLGTTAHGLYIESFIPPDRLDASFIRENLGRVRAAAACAIKSGAKIVSLGGFSSILIEGNFAHLPDCGGTVFTTGNTLTVAFIVQGIKKVCTLEGKELQSSTLLIVGATGDVGSGVARCLAPLVDRVLLNARNVERLQGGYRRGPGTVAGKARRSRLRGEPRIAVAAAGWHRARLHRVRCRISEKSVTDFWRGNDLLWRTGASLGRYCQRA
jgi:predicted amino acid dehydrogenase